MKTQYTDQELKQALAKMLPEQVFYHHDGLCYSHISEKIPIGLQGHFVLDTELLQITLDIAQGLRGGSHFAFERELQKEMDGDGSDERGHQLTCLATWQQRTIALAPVKGIEL